MVSDIACVANVVLVLASMNPSTDETHDSFTCATVAIARNPFGCRNDVCFYDHLQCG
jgi:hypothetical protein